MVGETGDHATRLSSQLFNNYRNSELACERKEAGGLGFRGTVLEAY